jgi:hypothetical protein
MVIPITDIPKGIVDGWNRIAIFFVEVKLFNM